MTRIVRAGGPERPRRRSLDATRVLPAGRLSSLREAEQALATASQHAAALLEHAAAEVVELRRRAEEESQARAVALLCRAEERARQIVRDARGELTTLAVRIAEKILGEQLRVHPDSVASIVRQCLRAFPGTGRVRLRAHPEDLPVLEAARPQLGGPAVAVELQADPQIARGGCVLESELGELDGRLESQLARLADALRGEPS
jgi:type III secretion system HrpE/YscL family protein